MVVNSLYESCRENLVKLIALHEATPAGRNEATTRLHLVDRLLFDCLGWSRDNCVAEAAYEGEYADYVCACPRPILIVEAKREGNYFEVPAGSTAIEYSIRNLIRDNPELGKAVNQVAHYCQTRGVLFGAVCNGFQLVAFVATRQDAPPLEGRAVVFPSLQFMLDNFQQFWNDLSAPGIEAKNLESRLVGRTKAVVPPKLAISISDYPGTKARNRFQTDLKIVSELVLEDLTNARELEETFLRECYIDSGTLSEYSILSRDILQARYSALFDSQSPGPSTEPAVTKKGVSRDLLAQSLSRRPILLLGDVGAGKTTFLRHLMNVSAATQFDNAVALHVNLGTQAALATDLRLFILDELARQLRDLFDFDIEDSSIVRAIYYGELKRFEKGIYSALRESNPSLYAEKEIALLEARLTDKAQHVKHALEHLEKMRRKQIIIILDNADQRDFNTQQQVFLIAQEISSSWPATVFLTLRPETFHLSLRGGGTLSGYHPKAFTIAPPRADRVIERRLLFGLRLTRGEVPIQNLVNVNVQLYTLEAILMAFLQTIRERREIPELIDNIAGGNVRLALDLVQMFFGSGHVDTEKIVEIYNRTGRYTIPLHEFVRAVTYGDTVHYDPTQSYICNVFDISTPDPKEHFLLPLIIGHLEHWVGPGMRNGFVETARLYDNLQSSGYTPEQIDASLSRAQQHNLIETSARRTLEPGHNLPPSIRATTVGVYHVRRLCKLFAYVDAMIVDTPIIDRSVREQLTNAWSITERVYRAELFCGYLDKQWAAVSDASGVFSWPLVAAELRDEIRRIREKQGIPERSDSEDLNPSTTIEMPL